MHPIFLLTDFGDKDYYVAAMKAVILSINPKAVVIDITHNIDTWNISEGGFVLWQIMPYLPKRSIIIGVVDPSVGTERKNIIIETKNHFLIGPDNGLLYSAAKRDGIKNVYEIDIEKPLYRNISMTFHGRDIYAPTGAYLSVNLDVNSLAKPINLKKIIRKTWPEPVIERDRALVQILHIDRFGNLITNISRKLYHEKMMGKIVSIEYRGEKFPIKEVKTFREVDEGEVGIIIGGSDMVEIVSNLDAASQILGVFKSGEKLVIHFR